MFKTSDHRLFDEESKYTKNCDFTLKDTDSRTPRIFTNHLTKVPKSPLFSLYT